MRWRCLKSKKAMTLMEVLVYIAILSVVIGTIYSIYYNCSQIAKVGNAYIHTLRYTDLVISAMQREIRQAKVIIPSVRNFVTDSDTLILKSGVGEDSYIIYRFDKEKGKIERVFFTEGSEIEGGKAIYTRTMGTNLQGIKFSYDKESLTDSRLVTVELIFRKGALKKAKEASLNFSVLLRG